MTMAWRLDPQRVSSLLEESVLKEKQQWQPFTCMSIQSGEVDGAARRGVVRWLDRLCERFRFHPGTLFLAVTLTDRFLRLVRTRLKYFRCLSLTCLYLAAKVNEEDEVIPSTSFLVELCEEPCSVAEVGRMERVVLDKLGWQLRYVTWFDQLHLMYAAALLSCPGFLPTYSSLSPTRHLKHLTRKLVASISCARAVSIPPSHMVLALLSVELETCTYSWPVVAILLQQLVHISDSELMLARELITEVLEKEYVDHSMASSVLKRRRIRCDSRGSSRPAKRQVLSVEEEDDIVCDLQFLYKTDEEVTSAPVDASDVVPPVALNKFGEDKGTSMAPPTSIAISADPKQPEEAVGQWQDGADAVNINEPQDGNLLALNMSSTSKPRGNFVPPMSPDFPDIRLVALSKAAREKRSSPQTECKRAHMSYADVLRLHLPVTAISLAV